MTIQLLVCWLFCNHVHKSIVFSIVIVCVGSFDKYSISVCAGSFECRRLAIFINRTCIELSWKPVRWHSIRWISQNKTNITINVLRCNSFVRYVHFRRSVNLSIIINNIVWTIFSSVFVWCVTFVHYTHQMKSKLNIWVSHLLSRFQTIFLISQRLLLLLNLIKYQMN